MASSLSYSTFETNQSKNLSISKIDQSGIDIKKVLVYITSKMYKIRNAST